jgi:hypothetical protein
MKKLALTTSSSLLMFPILANAQGYSSDIVGLTDYLVSFAKTSLLWLIFSLAVIFFLWNVMNYLRKPDKVQESGKYILWGLIALTAMFTIYSIIYLFADTLNFDVGIPQFYVGQSN